MAEEKAFSVAKLATYSDEYIRTETASMTARIQKLRSLSSAYNGEVRTALQGRDQRKAIAEGEHWGAMRDAADAMADELAKKVASAQVELDLRTMS